MDFEALLQSAPGQYPVLRPESSTSSIPLDHGASGVALFRRRRRGKWSVVASYTVNKASVVHARELIEARQYVLDSDWGEAQPRADEENRYLKSHTWEEYARWFLGQTDGATDGTKARYAFVYGDFRRIHRTGLIACLYRAAEWRHKDVERAAYDLLQRLDEKAA